MNGLPDGSAAALAPVRELLTATAQKQAADISREANDQAQSLVAAARHESDRIVAAAAEEGRAAARLAAALGSARTRRQANEAVLAQQNAIRSKLQREATRSALALRTDPRYPNLLTALTKQSHILLGADATVTESPNGGVLVESGSRRMDLSLPALVARTLDSMTEEVGRVWAP